MRTLREKNAHKECPEFEQVQRDLDEYERKAIEKLNAEYNATQRNTLGLANLLKKRRQFLLASFCWH
jgi:hypothetical protein